MEHRNDQDGQHTDHRTNQEDTQHARRSRMIWCFRGESMEGPKLEEPRLSSVLRALGHTLSASIGANEALPQFVLGMHFSRNSSMRRLMLSMSCRKTTSL